MVQHLPGHMELHESDQPCGLRSAKDRLTRSPASSGLPIKLSASQGRAHAWAVRHSACIGLGVVDHFVISIILAVCFSDADAPCPRAGVPTSPFTHAHNSAFPQSSPGFPWRQQPDDGRQLSQPGAGKSLPVSDSQQTGLELSSCAQLRPAGGLLPSTHAAAACHVSGDPEPPRLLADIQQTAVGLKRQGTCRQTSDRSLATAGHAAVGTPPVNLPSVSIEAGRQTLCHSPPTAASSQASLHALHPQTSC